DRPAAVRRLARALTDTVIGGLTTNRQYLLEIAAHPAFAAGEVDTGFVDRHAGDLLPSARPADDRILALAACHVLIGQRAAAADRAARGADPWSPWHLTNGWRLNCEAMDAVRFRDGEATVVIGVRHRGAGWRLTLPGGDMDAAAEPDADGMLAVDLDGRRMRTAVVADGDAVIVMADGRAHRLLRHDPGAAAAAQVTGGGTLTSPMPGKIVRVQAQDGEKVRRGAPLVVLEAMKMEHTIAAPADGTVVRIAFQVGDMVEEGVALVTFEPG
ncbi:MAG: biotin/lipoyl-containing protein, partial [Alphaproteobacteria bacterium]